MMSAIPTSYGMVISFINERGLLERLYLNDVAVEELTGPDNERVIADLSMRGLDIAAFKQKLPRISGDVKICRDICEENSWDLFSLHPMQLSLQLLRHCNAKCDFCYAGAPETTAEGFMDMGTAKRIKDYAAENGVKLGMTGGEPLLHPDILELLAYRGEEVYDTLITNLTPRVNMDALAATGVDLVQVSIHGRGATHDTTLGLAGAFRKATERMARLMSTINVATNTVITPANMAEIPELASDLARIQESQGCSLAYARFAPVLPSGSGRGRYSTAESFFADARNLLERIEREWSNEIELELPLLHPNPYEYMDLGDRTTCPAGATVAVVRMDGHVCPCNQFADTKTFSDKTVDQSDFWDIWLHDTLLGSMRRARKKTKDGNFCGGCAYLTSLDCGIV